MWRSKERDPFWELTKDQMHVAGALKSEYVPISDVLKEATSNNGTKIDGRVRWERLYVFGILDIDINRKDGVYVKRGPLWDGYWKNDGLGITKSELLNQEAFRGLDKYFDNPTTSNK